MHSHEKSGSSAAYDEKKDEKSNCEHSRKSNWYSSSLGTAATEPRDCCCSLEMDEAMEVTEAAGDRAAGGRGETTERAEWGAGGGGELDSEEMLGSAGCNSGDGTGELARDDADDAEALLVLRDMLGEAVMDELEAVETGESAGDAVAVDDVLPFFRRPDEEAAAVEIG